MQTWDIRQKSENKLLLPTCGVAFSGALLLMNVLSLPYDCKRILLSLSLFLEIGHNSLDLGFT